MKIELEIKDLNILLSALSISIHHIGQQILSIEFGCEYDKTTSKLFKKYNITDEDEQISLLKERYYELKYIYNQLEEIERGIINE